MMFLLYINELPMIINDVCVLFADDAIVLFSAVKSHGSNVESNISCTLKKMVEWLGKLNFIVNLIKTKLVQF